MRIGIVTDNYFPSVGGTEISIYNYSQRLEKMGHQVFVFCPNQGRKNPKESKISTVRMPAIRGIYPDHPLMFVYPGIIKKYKEYKLDVLHSQTPITAPYIAEYVARRLNIPHIHTMHTLVPEQVKRWKGGLLRFSLLFLVQSLILGTFARPKNYLLQDEKQTSAIKVRLSWIYMLRFVNLPDAVIFPSKSTRDIFKARGFEGRSYCLPTFSDLFLNKNQKTSNLRTHDEVRIIYVGRLDIEKRPQVAIDAVNLLPDYLDWKLIVVGSGNQSAKLVRLVRKYNLEEKVIFKGKRNQEEIANELLNADILVMPSYRFDTQGIVLLEACGAGLPIVYCDDNLTIGVEETNSILTKPYAMSVSAGLQKLIEEEGLRQKMSKASHEIFLKYDAQKLSHRLVRIYKEVTLAQDQTLTQENSKT